jgi:ABC-2 type transport system ATP-binding protein
MVAVHSELPESVIEVAGLTRRFGPKVALDDVRLAVPRGTVFGLVGVNGAGKTTLIKHVLGLLRAATGSVRVFGKDPAADPAGVLVNVGYLSEEPDLPGWMRVGELLRYTRAFYPNWDPAFAEELRESFAIDPAARVKHLSKGQRARVGLVLALAHRPELLVLDEPSSGLDPIVRRDILGAIIRTIAEEGRTVLFSSHLLHEVERVADRVALIDRGRVVFSGALDDIKDSHHRLTLRFPEPRPQPPALAGVLAWEGQGSEWAAVYAGRLDDLQDAVAACGARVVERRVPSLDEIFVARVGTRCSEQAKE